MGEERYSEKLRSVCVWGGGSRVIDVQTNMLVYSQEPAVKSVYNLTQKLCMQVSM